MLALVEETPTLVRAETAMNIHGEELGVRGGSQHHKCHETLPKGCLISISEKIIYMGASASETGVIFLVFFPAKTLDDYLVRQCSD